jgi:hypothetical protein
MLVWYFLIDISIILVYININDLNINKEIFIKFYNIMDVVEVNNFYILCIFTFFLLWNLLVGIVLACLRCLWVFIMASLRLHLVNICCWWQN